MSDILNAVPPGFGKVVAMVQHGGRLVVATERAVWFVSDDGYLHCMGWAEPTALPESEND